MKLSPSVVEDYLGDYGWAFRRVGEACWLTGWRGDERSFPLTLTLTESWLLLEVRPFVALSEDQTAAGDLARYLLELNHLSHMIKLSMDPENAIILSVQMFAQDLKYDEFADALGVLGYYAELLYDDIYTRARNAHKIVVQKTRFLT